MKYIKVLTILLASVLSFYACDDNSDAIKKEARESIKVTDTPAQPSDQTTPKPAQNAEGVWHYTCNKGCAGGAGVAGNCANCGEPLAHNAAYHGTTAGTPTTVNPNATPSTSAELPSVEPAQNAAGVWHYTCAKGCAGGSGSVTASCATCGGSLTHNKVYHQ